MRARCYGATFDELRGGTVLRRRLLPEPTSVERAGDAPLDGGVILSWDASHRDPLEEDVLAEGDLTRLNFGQLRVSVSIEEASMGSEDPLLKLAMRLRTDLREEKTLRFEAVRGSTTSGEEISMTVVGLDGDDDPKLPPGQAGDSKRLSIEVEENRTDLNAFEFTLPASTLSMARPSTGARSYVGMMTLTVGIGRAIGGHPVCYGLGNRRGAARCDAVGTPCATRCNAVGTPRATPSTAGVGGQGSTQSVTSPLA